MALITCPKCGKQFSEHANSCPQCGMSTANQLSRKTFAIFGFVLVVWMGINTILWFFRPINEEPSLILTIMSRTLWGLYDIFIIGFWIYQFRTSKYNVKLRTIALMATIFSISFILSTQISYVLSSYKLYTYLSWNRWIINISVLVIGILTIIYSFSHEKRIRYYAIICGIFTCLSVCWYPWLMRQCSDLILWAVEIESMEQLDRIEHVIVPSVLWLGSKLFMVFFIMSFFTNWKQIKKRLFNLPNNKTYGTDYLS